MDTEMMIRELRRLSEKHKDDKVYTFQTNWSLLCKSVANRLEELLEYKCMYKDLPWKPKFNEKYYSIGTDGDIETGTWLNDFLDYTLYKIGNCYQTPEAARVDRSKWGSFYSSDEILKI